MHTIKVSYDKVRLTAEEISESRKARKIRAAVCGERIKFLGFYSASLNGGSWIAAKFVAKDGETYIYIPLSKLPGAESLSIHSWYTVKEKTRHYLLLEP